MSSNTSQLAGFVPVPNALFEVLSSLTDTETKVLFVVIRNTLGFREPAPSGGTAFRQRCWLAHSLLQEKTGRSSAAISLSIQNLVSRGLIVVENERGLPLPTADERRRNMGKLYFRLGDNVWTTGRRSDIGKPKTITYKKGIYIQGEIARSPAQPQHTSSGFTHIGAILERRE